MNRMTVTSNKRVTDDVVSTSSTSAPIDSTLDQGLGSVKELESNSRYKSLGNGWSMLIQDEEQGTLSNQVPVILPDFEDTTDYWPDLNPNLSSVYVMIDGNEPDTIVTKFFYHKNVRVIKNEEIVYVPQSQLTEADRRSFSPKGQDKIGPMIDATTKLAFVRRLAHGQEVELINWQGHEGMYVRVGDRLVSRLVYSLCVSHVKELGAATIFGTKYISVDMWKLRLVSFNAHDIDVANDMEDCLIPDHGLPGVEFARMWTMVLRKFITVEEDKVKGMFNLLDWQQKHLKKEIEKGRAHLDNPMWTSLSFKERRDGQTTRQYGWPNDLEPPESVLDNMVVRFQLKNMKQYEADKEAGGNAPEFKFDYNVESSEQGEAAASAEDNPWPSFPIWNAFAVYECPDVRKQPSTVPDYFMILIAPNMVGHTKMCCDGYGSLLDAQ